MSKGMSKSYRIIFIFDSTMWKRQSKIFKKLERTWEMKGFIIKEPTFYGTDNFIEECSFKITYHIKKFVASHHKNLFKWTIIKLTEKKPTLTS